MVDEPEVPEISKPDRLFRRQHWPVFVLGGGAIVFLTAFVVWRWPLTTIRRQHVEERLAAAASAAEQEQFAKAFDLLTELSPQLWRIGNRRGEAYFLLGHVNNRLADRSSEPEKANAFYRAAIVCLNAAREWRLPAHQAVAFSEELGHAEQRLGRGGAEDLLHAALNLRRRFEALLNRRLAVAALQRTPPETPTAAKWVDLWAALPELSEEETQEIRTLRSEIKNGRVEEALEILQRPLRPYAERAADLRILGEHLERTESASDNAESAAIALRNDNSRQMARILDDLARLYSERSEPDFSKAARYGEELLANGNLAPDLHNDALRRQAEALLAIGEPLKAQRCLAAIASDYPDRPMVQFLLARSYFEQASAPPADAAKTTPAPWWRQPLDRWRDRGRALFSDWMYLQAAALCQRIIADPAVRDEGHYGQALLMLGASQQQLGRLDLAEQSFERVINGFPGSAFERAARFLLADTLRRAHSNRAVAALQRAAEASKPPAGLKNRYLPERQLHQIFTEAWREYMDQRALRSAVEAGLAYKGFAPAGDAEQMVADAAVELAKDLDRQAGSLPFDKAAANRSEARALYRLAGENFGVTAEARRATLSYGDYLWQAALSWFEGQAYEEAIAAFNRFLPVHGGAERDFLAVLYLGRCHMAQQRFETARQLLEKALIDHPRAPDRFNGRLQLARCYQELARSEAPAESSAGQSSRVGELFAAAEALLLANIDGQFRDLEPAAWEWRRSLFMLGSVLHETGRYDEAISRFHEAVRRYPEDQETATARYLIADAYLQSAKKPAELLAKETAPRGQALLRDEMVQRLESAKKQFGELIAILLERQSRQALRPEEETYLRNCYFGIGEVSMALEDWPAAIDAYTTAANRYQDRPDALIAYVQIANAYWRLGKDGDARGTLRQARWILRQMDEKVFDGATLTKEQWTSRLESLVGRL